MNAIGALRIFDHGHEQTDAPLVPLMRATRKIPQLVMHSSVKDGEGVHLTEDAQRLRAVWDMEKRRPGVKISQKAMALEWGVNASNITQYLNGHIKLNTEAKDMAAFQPGLRRSGRAFARRRSRGHSVDHAAHRLTQDRSRPA